MPVNCVVLFTRAILPPDTPIFGVVFVTSGVGKTPPIAPLEANLIK